MNRLTVHPVLDVSAPSPLGLPVYYYSQNPAYNNDTRQKQILHTDIFRVHCRAQNKYLYCRYIITGTIGSVLFLVLWRVFSTGGARGRRRAPSPAAAAAATITAGNVATVVRSVRRKWAGTEHNTIIICYDMRFCRRGRRRSAVDLSATSWLQ